MTMELTNGKKDLPNGPPSRLIMYLQSRSLEMKDQVRVIKCHRDSNQAFEIYSSIEQARSVYGPAQSKVNAYDLSTNFCKKVNALCDQGLR